MALASLPLVGDVNKYNDFRLIAVRKGMMAQALRYCMRGDPRADSEGGPESAKAVRADPGNSRFLAELPGHPVHRLPQVRFAGYLADAE